MNWDCKHELLGTIVDEIFKYTYYPSTYEVTSAAKCLIDSYPYLTEKIGSGYDGWVVSIRNKLKNSRRKLDIPVISCRKRKPTSSTQIGANLKRKKFASGTNAFPSMPDGEDDTSAQAHVEEMKLEMKSPRRDNCVIHSSMNKTYAYRRKLVNDCAPVSNILKEYPSLEMMEIIDEEMCRVTGKTDLMKTCKNNCTRYSSGFLELARKKKTESVTNILHTMDNVLTDLPEQTPAEVSRVETTTAMILLTDVFGEDCQNYVNIYGVNIYIIFQCLI